ncbi:NDP-sugar epimerase, includes UDP-GlcNAc-inverting 4,6-dehydratase FlaA1 and capsular polysaccharide biosynthesis protein EpsC [Roseovarius pacificus]|uniref:NDP-sugar epimerase, includes UDP-GlcNAc-inverting 4,6-dehydratase FlaA1 and capsular polysaccharide biosynthesis protein EpsC n=1 Tax=Roseovarius pacificus TaxID=337701 RepID=A0A1M6WVN7_9RHOB|nr:nucleoside-diphosphate sugar epimerase/dehydratase [Roseovarius pacificus]SHK97783.1 NDP-sugar epimerase, includes UDP-GlcNAc-inverting 4,6-dehydratase FlaA1 and capsular polysaccharide biosynthesis protein EpsC [Roseovarius pacificus]
MLYQLLTRLDRPRKNALLLALDICLIGVACLLAILVLFGPNALAQLADPLVLVEAGFLMAGGGIAILALGLHRIKLNAYQIQGLHDTALVAALLGAFGIVASLVLRNELPPHVFAVAAMLFLILSVASRLLLRQLVLKLYRDNTQRRRILIYGAGQTGQQLASALTTDDALQAVAFVDDDRRLQGLAIAGLRVYPANDVPALVAQHRIDRIVLAMPSASETIQVDIRRRLADTGCEVHILPSFCDLVDNTARRPLDTRPLDLDNILGRDRLEQELPGVSLSYRGASILVTGAGGSIGSELSRQLISCTPRRLILLDHNELALFEIDRQLRAFDSDVEIVTILGSVCDGALMKEVMDNHDINIVLHAAAYKHLPMVEGNALAGMRNNVLGTKTVADAAREANVDRFILVSTDKAVRPKSMMGASKRLAELLVQDLATRSTTTRFSMVRFGNVLGSSGSVLPLFREQIANGGPVTLTHTDVTRYFMTIPEAVRLVLLAGSFTYGGDVFVLDMGKPVLVRDIAHRMIEQAGLTVRDAQNPDGDIEIKVTGLRPGEKLHEELLIGSDMLTTPHPKILRAQESHLSELEMAKALSDLRKAIETRNLDLLNDTLTQWIETAPQKPAVQMVVAE